MSCHEVSKFLDAYVDEELDVVTTSQFDRHLTECAACRANYDKYRQMHRSTKAHMEYFRAPEHFEQKLRARLNLPGQYPEKTSVPKTNLQKTGWLEWFPRWGAWAAAASALTIVLLTALLLQVARRPSPSDTLAQQVVASHIRSLLANHLSDVISTDQHTVKPWFTGKLDFAPVVKDLSSQGFPLAGGRLDYLDDRPVAALVYKRRQHTINVFLWPSPSSDSKPQTLTIRGYNLAHWTHSHMAYWAVSDVNASDLGELVQHLQN